MFKKYNPIFDSIDLGSFFNDLEENYYIFSDDTITEQQRLQIAKSSIYYYNNMPIVHSAIEKMIDFTIGNGITFSLSEVLPAPGRNEIEMLINTRFDDLTTEPDCYYFVRKLLRNLLLYGRAYICTNDYGKIKILNEFHINESEAENGIYYTVNTESAFIPNYRLIRVFNSPKLGVIYPCGDMIEKLKKYVRSELISSCVASLFSVFITKQEESNPLLEEIEKIKKPSGLEPGVIFELNSGESVQSVNPSRPNSNFSEFVTFISKHICSCIGTPYELSLQSFSNSYSSSRAAFSIFANTCTKYQNILERYFYRVFLRKILQTSKYNNQIEIIERGRFIMPNLRSISPKEDAEIMKIERDLNLSNEEEDKLRNGYY